MTLKPVSPSLRATPGQGQDNPKTLENPISTNKAELRLASLLEAPWAVRRWLATRHAEDRRIFASSAVVTILALVNGGVSYLVQVLLAAHFGTGREMDAYLVAYALPLLIATAVSDAIALTLVPVFLSQWSNRGKDEAWRLTNSVVTMLFVGLVGLTATLWVFAEQCMKVIAPGLVGTSRTLSVELLRLMLPTIGCLVLSGGLTAVHHALNRFTQPAMAPIANAVTMFICIFVLVPKMGIYAVALGTTLGAASRVVCLLPVLLEARKAGNYWHWHHPEIGQFWSLTIPLALAGLAFKGNVVIERFIASWMPEGRIASLGYAYQIAFLLIVLATQGLGITLFPQMSSEAAVEKMKKVGTTLANGMRWTILILTPVIAGVAILREPIIRLLFQRGAFNETSVHDTSLALLGYLGAVYAGGLANLPSRAFVAVKDVWTGIRIGVAGTALLIVLDLGLAAWLGYVGLALAYSLMSAFTLALWLRAISRRFEGFDWRKVFSSAISTLQAAAGMAIVCFFLKKMLSNVLPDTRMGTTLELAIIGITACGLYLALIALLARVRNLQ